MGGGGGAKFGILGGQGGPNSQQAHDVISTSCCREVRDIFCKQGVLILFFALICSIAPTGDLLFAYLAPLEWSYFTYSIGAS